MFKNTVILVIIFVVFLFNLALDVLEILERILEALSVGFLLIILQAINTVLDIIISFLTEVILIAIGGFQFRRQVGYLLTSLAEFIPVLDLLPLRTIGLIITVYLMWRGEVQKEAGLEELQQTEETAPEESEGQLEEAFSSH